MVNLVTQSQIDPQLQAPLLQLPQDVVLLFLRTLDRRAALSFFSCCKKTRQFFPLVPQFLEKCLETYLKNQNLRGVQNFVANFKPTNLSFDLSIDGNWEGLSAAISCIQQKFERVVLRFSLNEQAIRCLPGLLTDCPNTKAVNLWHSPHCTVDMLSDLFSKVSLRTLHTPRRVENYQSIDFPTTLEELDIRMSAVSQATLTAILTRCSKLTRLDVRSCLQLDHFEQVTYPSTLGTIILRHTAINDLGFQHLLASCPSLRTLDLVGCKKISTPAFRSASYPPTLQAIALEGCAIDSYGVAKIKQDCPQATVTLS